MIAKNQSQSVSIPSAPIVTLVDDIPTTLSTDVATYFGKRHDVVLRAIEKIAESLPKDRLHNFAETVVERPNPSGGDPIQSKAYRLTRDGFTFLAMGFTGAKAQAFKWSYIDAFNKLEASTLRASAKPLLGVESPAVEVNSHRLPTLTVAIADALRHTNDGFSSPSQKAQSANSPKPGAFSMRAGSSWEETSGAPQGAPVPFARSANPLVSPTRLAAASESYNLQKEPVMSSNNGNLQPVRFELDGLSLRVFNINGEPWFSAADVAKGIGHSNPSKAISVLREKERSNFKLDRGGSLAIISESGLYTILLRSDAALKEGTAAYKFRIKVTDEVLPQIRKTGSYSTNNQKTEIAAPAVPALPGPKPVEINLYGTRVDVESFTVCDYFGINHKEFMENVSEYVRQHPYMLRRFELKTRSRTVDGKTVTQHYCTIDKPGLVAIIRDYYGENEELVRFCKRFDPLLENIRRYDYVDHPQEVVLNELARPIVRIEDNTAMTTTQDVAFYYGKTPEAVAEAAQKAAAALGIGVDDGSDKIISWPQWNEPGYLIGRDVFTVMVAGWKGVRDLKHTRAYLMEFDIKDQAERDRQLDFVARTSDSFARKALVTIEGDSVTAVRLTSRTMVLTEEELIERIEGKKNAFDLSMVRQISDAVFRRLNREADHGF